MLGLFRVSRPVSLEPFGRWHGGASAVSGLANGDGPQADGQVFHTDVHDLAAGAATVDLVFRDLVADRGRMVLSVLVEPEDATDALGVQGEVVIDLAALAQAGGRYSWPVMIRPGRRYAFAGRMIEPGDAQATGLEVEVTSSPEAPTFARRLAEAQASVSAAPAAEDMGVVASERAATLADPRSQMCTAAQFDEPDYDRWIALMHRYKHRHRKQWEYVWICRTLEVMGCLVPDARGLGFGCGIEPLPAVFAAHGARVTATDLGAEDRRARRWQETAQHLLSVEALNDPAICPPERFFAQVEVDAIDMNAVPADRTGYDFCWSSCSLEHLGTIEAGLRFIERSLDTLRPGGVAVHTTEFNLSSDSRTIARGGTVLFRRRDLVAFAHAMAAAGHEVVPMTFDQGDQPEDRFVDMPPYAADEHFKLALKSYVTTSFGLAIRKKR